jgi:Tfp pilus assembly protein PilX
MSSFLSSTVRRMEALRRQDGITLIIAIGVMFVTSMLLVGAFTAADGEIHLSSSDTAQKKAYYAALAGVENYENHLTEDGNYLSYCTEPPSPNPALNQVGETTHRATILKENGESNNEEYAIQLLPAESAPENDRKCDSKNLVSTMLEEKSAGAVGTFRIESTGYSGKEERTIVATFRNANFVSFVWYTKFETGDPAVYGEAPKGEPNYFTECAKFYGERPKEGGSPNRCRNNFFINGESVNGPMHTEDHAGVCGSPVFGRTGNDRIEFGHASGKPEDEGFSNEGLSCTATPVFKGKHLLPKEVLSIEPPPGDEELKHVVEKNYEYTGKTEIALEGSVMTVSQWEWEPIKKEYVKKSTPDVGFPPNGVIYIKQESCPEAYSPFGPKPKYTEDQKCGNVYVHGEYTSSLTIASENDVIINGNITTPHETSGAPTSNALLGLIANNFVRVYHPVVETYEGAGTKKETCNTNGKKVVEKYNSSLKACERTDNAEECDAPNSETLDLKEPTIYAAMLAVKHAVIVDNFNCGAATLGNLNVYGAVAGLFTNGFTGEFSGSTIVHGYPYDANYDNRLQVEEPPHFLNPIEASWSVQRETLAPNPSY